MGGEAGRIYKNIYRTDTHVDLPKGTSFPGMPCMCVGGGRLGRGRGVGGVGCVWGGGVCGGGGGGVCVGCVGCVVVGVCCGGGVGGRGGGGGSLCWLCDEGVCLAAPSQK